MLNKGEHRKKRNKCSYIFIISIFGDKNNKKDFNVDDILGNKQDFNVINDILYFPLKLPFLFRFSEEKLTSSQKSHFLPFGLGPRDCFGKEFALMEVKLALVHLLQRYEVSILPETEVSIT